jgi:hypothetical protein
VVVAAAAVAVAEGGISMNDLRTSAWRRVALAWGCATALAVAATAPGAATTARKTFETPEAAMAAFGEAVDHQDEAALKGLLGADFRDLIPPVGDELRTKFLAAWAQSHTIEPQGATSAHIAVGTDGWTMPIPLEKTAKGWEFDTLAGVDEIRFRRVGRNELSVIQTMQAVVDAQRDYASTTHDGVAVMVYASRLESSPGKHDGLYWPTQPGEPESPLGPAFLQAHVQAAGSEGYHGYRYKLLTAQGPHATGGAYDYMVNGRLFGGFGVMAWPVRYQDTGVKSFIVNHDGQVYERDLGPKSAERAAATKVFDPGPGWTKVSP